MNTICKPATIYLCLDKKGRVVVCIDGPLRLVVDRRALQHLRRYGMRQEESSGSFWDFLKQGVHAISKIAETPLVKAALQKYVPFGGVALTAVQTASVALDLGQKVLNKHPKTTKLVQALADPSPRGDGARAMLAQIKQLAKNGDAGAVARLGKIKMLGSLLTDMGNISQSI